MDNMNFEYTERCINCTWNSRLTSISSCSSGDLATGSIRHEQKDLKEQKQNDQSDAKLTKNIR